MRPGEVFAATAAPWLGDTPPRPAPAAPTPAAAESEPDAPADDRQHRSAPPETEAGQIPPRPPLAAEPAVARERPTAYRSDSAFLRPGGRLVGAIGAADRQRGE